MDNQLENTSLAEGIESNEAAPVIIDKEIPYVPIEELFNTSEYDAYIDTMDVAQLQQLEASTADIDKFRFSANKYNYDSQAFIYNQLFNYEMVFIVIDKTTHQIKICDCSESFYEKGQDKVKEAVAQYQLFYKTKDFDSKQFFKTETL